MGVFANIQDRIKDSGFLILLVFLFLYFTFYTINGDRGVLKYMYLKNEIAQSQRIAEQYSQQKQKLEAKVKLLSSSSLDLDLLDERVRFVLNFVGKDEFVILDSTQEE